MNQTAETEPVRERGNRTAAVLIAILLLLMLLLCGVGYFFVRVLVPAGTPAQPQTSEGMTWVRSIYGFGPSAEEQFLGPTDVAVAPNGRIYATDPQRARVLAFNPDGTFAGIIHTGFGGSGEGQLGRPAGLACDRMGNVYISDQLNGKIIVFDSDYAYVREWPAEQALGLRVVDETLYVRRLGEVVTYTLEGVEKSRFGERGRGFGSLIEPAGGVVADDERVYIADALNQAIKAFSPAGDLLWAQPSSDGTTAVQPAEETSAAETTAASSASSASVDLPQDVELDATGRLYAVDAFSFSILRLDPATGAVLAQYGHEGTEDGQFTYPTGIAYDAARDWFVVADTANNRVQIVRIAGSGGGVGQTFARALSSPFRVCAIPLLALLLALLIIWLTRGRRRADNPEGQEEGVEPLSVG